MGNKMESAPGMRGNSDNGKAWNTLREEMADRYEAMAEEEEQRDEEEKQGDEAGKREIGKLTVENTGRQIEGVPGEIYAVHVGDEVREAAAASFLLQGDGENGLETGTYYNGSEVANALKGMIEGVLKEGYGIVRVTERGERKFKDAAEVLADLMNRISQDPSFARLVVEDQDVSGEDPSRRAISAVRRAGEGVREVETSGTLVLGKENIELKNGVMINQEQIQQMLEDYLVMDSGEIPGPIGGGHGGGGERPGDGEEPGNGEEPGTEGEPGNGIGNEGGEVPGEGGGVVVPGGGVNETMISDDERPEKRRPGLIGRLFGGFRGRKKKESIKEGVTEGTEQIGNDPAGGGTDVTDLGPQVARGEGGENAPHEGGTMEGTEQIGNDPAGGGTNITDLGPQGAGGGGGTKIDEIKERIKDKVYEVIARKIKEPRKGLAAALAAFVFGAMMAGAPSPKADIEEVLNDPNANVQPKKARADLETVVDDANVDTGEEEVPGEIGVEKVLKVIDDITLGGEYSLQEGIGVSRASDEPAITEIGSEYLPEGAYSPNAVSVLDPNTGEIIEVEREEGKTFGETLQRKADELGVPVESLCSSAKIHFNGADGPAGWVSAVDVVNAVDTTLKPGEANPSPTSAEYWRDKVEPETLVGQSDNFDGTVTVKNGDKESTVRIVDENGTALPEGTEVEDENGNRYVIRNIEITEGEGGAGEQIWQVSVDLINFAAWTTLAAAAAAATYAIASQIESERKVMTEMTEEQIDDMIQGIENQFDAPEEYVVRVNELLESAGLQDSKATNSDGANTLLRLALVSQKITVDQVMGLLNSESGAEGAEGVEPEGAESEGAESEGAGGENIENNNGNN